MHRNLSDRDRVSRLILAVFFIGIATYFTFVPAVGANTATTNALSIVSFIVGAVLAVTGLAGYCLMYMPFGINTYEGARRKAGHKDAVGQAR